MTTETREGIEEWGAISHAGDGKPDRFTIPSDQPVQIGPVAGWLVWRDGHTVVAYVLDQERRDRIIADHNDAARYRTALERIAKWPRPGDSADELLNMRDIAEHALTPQPEQAG